MTLLSMLINKEKVRNENMIFNYLKELKKLPKGSVKTKKIGNRNYFYLAYRDGNKVVNKYLGKNENAIEIIKDQLERRKQIEKLLKDLMKEKEQIKRIEESL